MSQTTATVESLDQFIISSVHKNPVVTDLFYGYHIELPSDGLIVIDNNLEIAGWIVGKSKVDAVEIVLNGSAICTIPLRTSRPRLANAFGVEGPIGESAKFGFNGQVKITDIKSDTDVIVNAVFVNGEKHPIGVLRLKTYDVNDLNNSEVKPDFIIIGAMKSATSAIYKYITQHPDVIQRHPKELDFFSRPSNFRKGISSYLANFGAKVDSDHAIGLIGEASPSYLFAAEAPERIKKFLPESKIILSLRDPVDRAISHYYHQSKRVKDETRSIEMAFGPPQIETAKEIIEAIENGETRPYKMEGWNTARYLLNGYYAYAVEKWLKHFPSEQVLILNYHDLETNPQQFVRSIFSFLELPDYKIPDLKKVYANKYPEVSPEVQSRIRKFFAPLNEKLSKEVGIHFFDEVNREELTSGSVTNNKPEDSQSRIVTLTERIRQYERTHDFEAAAQACEQIMALQPTDAEVIATSARVQLKLNNLQTALRLYQQATELSGDLPAWVYMTGAHTLRKLGQKREAITQYKKALGINSELQVAHKAIVELSLETQAWQDAISHAQIAKALDHSLIPVMDSHLKTAVERQMEAQSKPSTVTEKSSTQKKQYDLVVCATVKNEAPYLLEWIAYHRALKVDHFLLYNNDSTDETNEILEALEKVGIVTQIKWPTKRGESPQLTAFQDAVTRLKNRSEWVAFVDVDEFIVPKAHNNLKTWLSQYDDAQAIAINWKMFGSSGEETLSEQLVIERFTKCAEETHSKNFIVKTIARVNAIERVYAHMCKLSDKSLYVYPDHTEFEAKGGPGHHVNHEIVQVNHYCIKSRTEWEIKRNKGLTSQKSRDIKRLESHFIGHDTNSETDKSALSFAKETKREIAHLEDLANLYETLSKVRTDLATLSSVAALSQAALGSNTEVEILDIIYPIRSNIFNQLSLSYEIISPRLEVTYNTNAFTIEGWITGENIHNSVIQVTYQNEVIAQEFSDRRLEEVEATPTPSDSAGIAPKKNFLVVLPLSGLQPQSELIVQLKLKKGRKIALAAVRIDPKPIRKEVDKLLTSNQREQAVVACQDRLRFNPLYWQALKEMGKIFENQNELGSALTCFRRAAAILPQSIDLRYKILCCLIKQQKIDEALRMME